MTQNTICVTGAGGFVAGHIIKLLLEKGYSVRGTVRNLNNKKSYEHLLELENGKTNLQLFEADNTVLGSFKEAMTGCEGLIHTASPFFHETDDMTEEYLREALIKPAVEGTTGALQTAVDCGVKKVVLTSSVAAIWGSQRTKNPRHVYTEDDWNDIEKVGYSLSKTMAEKAAWKFVEENPSIQLVTINPAFVLGPVLSSRSCESVEWVRMFFNSAEITTAFVKNVDPEKGVHSGILSYVDVRVVAQSHVAALEKDTAKGRYITANTPQFNFKDAAKILSEKYPQYSIPYHLKEGSEDLVPLEIANDHSKAERELGVEFLPWEKSLYDMADSLIARGMIPKK